MSRRPLFGDTMPTQMPGTEGALPAPRCRLNACSSGRRRCPDPAACQRRNADDDTESRLLLLAQWLVFVFCLLALLHAWLPLLTQRPA